MARRETCLKYFLENEAYVRMRVQNGVEQYRKGDVKLKITDKNGAPVAGAKVYAEQKTHEFKYGANIFMLDEFENEEKNKTYREAFRKVFNLATLPFYWNALEPERGKPRYTVDSPKIYRRPPTDLCLDYCLENGIEPKCHCLNYANVTPDWLMDEDVPTQKKYLEKRFGELAARYADKIPSWEVTNETLQHWNCDRFKFYYEDDFVEWSFRTADRYFSNNRLVINDYNVGGLVPCRDAYYSQIRLLLSQNIRLDSIGFQFHSFFSREAEPKEASHRYDPLHLYDVLDAYARLGKKLQITEMTLPAYSDEAEDEDVQAELLKKVYSVFFSHPAMEAVIYWNLVDGYAAAAPLGDMTAGENVFRGGLMRFDLSEKPAYKMLKKLFAQEWRTETETGSDDSGTASFRGFFGGYDVKIVTPDGKETTVQVVTSEKKHNVFKLTV